VIVRQTSGALQLITQADHAHLAGAIMQQSVALAAHPRRASILLAITEHDNGWEEPDAAPLIDPVTGFPLDFIAAPIGVRQGVWPRGVARLAHNSWAAALVAQHALEIFARYRSDMAWTPFFVRMEAMRGTMLHASGASLSELVDDYRFLGLGDVISLTFCNGWTDEQRFDEWRVRLSGSQVVVSPDVFGGIAIPIAVNARELRQRAFRSGHELRDELAASSVTTVDGVVMSQPA
jgi:uncharacterized protein DUF3891